MCVGVCVGGGETVSVYVRFFFFLFFCFFFGGGGGYGGEGEWKK